MFSLNIMVTIQTLSDGRLTTRLDMRVLMYAYVITVKLPFTSGLLIDMELLKNLMKYGEPFSGVHHIRNSHRYHFIQSSYSQSRIQVLSLTITGFVLIQRYNLFTNRLKYYGNKLILHNGSHIISTIPP